MASYLLGDGRGTFIRRDAYSGKYVPVRNESLADVWQERYKAQNILKNALSKKDKKSFHIIERADAITEKPKEETVAEVNKAARANLHIDKVKEISEQDIKDGQMSKWQDGLAKFTGFILESENRKQELVDALSNIDKEITDIEHYVELNNLNAYQGFLAYKMLQNRLRERRKIKNELQVLSQLGNCKIDSAMMLDVQNAIKLMDSKTYTPRVLVDLFK